MIERQHLQMVKTIHDVGTVTQAAKALYVTQSALSHAMKKLEHQTGVAIWQKSGRKLTLTSAGRSILVMANKVLPQFQRFEAELEAIQKGFKGTLKLGIECYPCFQWLLKVVAPYLQQYPDVDVDVKNEFQFGGLGALFNHDIDLLITPDPLHKKGVTYIPVFDYEQVLLVHKSHALAEHNYVSPADLAEQVLFTYPVETSRLDVFNQFLTPGGHSVKRHRTLENTEMLMEMVKNIRGVAVLPDWLVKQNESAELRTVRLGSEGLSKTTFIAIRSDDSQSRFVEEFVDMAKQVC